MTLTRNCEWPLSYRPVLAGWGPSKLFHPYEVSQRKAEAPWRPLGSSEPGSWTVCLRLGWAIRNHLVVLAKNVNLKKIRGRPLRRVHRCICSQDSLKAPITRERNQTGRAAAVQLPVPSSGAELMPHRGRAMLTVRPAPNGQAAGGGSRADLAIDFQVSVKKVLKHLCLYGGGRKQGTQMLAACRAHPEPVLDGHGAQLAGRVRYHSFFFSSMETPPGPRATTRSRPPITDMVWKKSYLRKSCMGL